MDFILSYRKSRNDCRFLIVVEDIMIGYLAGAFLLGGFFGMLGMAIVASGPKNTLLRDLRILTNRIVFLEREDPRKRYQPVKDPRQKVHALVN